MKTHAGLTRLQILAQIPEMGKGSFELFIAKAGIKKIGEIPGKRPHIKAYIYPLDSVNKLRQVIK